MRNKLIALNLALILLVSIFLSMPSASAVGEKDLGSERNCQQATGVPIDDSKKAPPQNAGASSIQADAMSVTPYLITVGGTPFYSNTNKSGSGWSYDASHATLNLTNYSGSSIRASGDLTIYSKDFAYICGNSEVFGANAITVSGSLSINIVSGSFRVYGGPGTYAGGDGIHASNLNLNIVRNDRDSIGFICNGGEGTTYGGWGICAGDINLFPGVSKYQDSSTISGGNSSVNAGYGIVFDNTLSIGVCQMIVQSGNTSGYAIASTKSGNRYYCSIYDDVVDESYRISFTPRIRTLTFDGNGGTYYGQGSSSVNCQYPNSIYLGDYLFTRSGYAQVGWTTGSNLILMDSRIPVLSNMTLSASWVPVQNKTVLFVGNGGKISGNDYVTAATQTAVNVPSRTEATRIDAYNIPMYLLGWCSDLSWHTDFNHVLNGTGTQKWYMPSSTQTWDRPDVLYARWISLGNIIYYDGNGGVSGLSPYQVQAILSTGSDMTLYVQNDLGFTKYGYTFTGWKDSNGTSYVAGQAIAPVTDLSVTTLQAQWARTFTIAYKRQRRLLQ